MWSPTTRAWWATTCDVVADHARVVGDDVRCRRGPCVRGGRPRAIWWATTSGMVSITFGVVPNHAGLTRGYIVEMPELPDVTVYVERLRAKTIGRTIEGIRIASPFVLPTVSPTPQELVAAKVIGVDGMGKRI